MVTQLDLFGGEVLEFPRRRRRRQDVGLLQASFRVCRQAAVNETARPAPPKPKPSSVHGYLENPLPKPDPARTMLSGLFPTLVERRRAMGLGVDDVAAIAWALRGLDYASGRASIRTERSRRGATNWHVSAALFPLEYEGDRRVQKWESGLLVPSAWDFFDWCNAVGLDVQLVPFEDRSG